MNYKKLKFSDIMQSKILYYDNEVEDACHNICDELKIDNMPDYDSKHYYELVNGVSRHLCFVPEKHIYKGILPQIQLDQKFKFSEIRKNNLSKTLVYNKNMTHSPSVLRRNGPYFLVFLHRHASASPPAVPLCPKTQ